MGGVMHLLRNGVVLSVVSQIIFGCVHKEGVSDHVVSAKPGTVVHRARRQALFMPPVAEDGAMAIIEQTEKDEVKLLDGTVGFFVRFPDGERVFLTREPFSYGTFDLEIDTLLPNEQIYSIPDMLTGVWRLAGPEDGSLLAEACTMFKGTSEVPYACVFGCWATPESSEYMLPIILPSGEMETLECDESAGLMYVKEKETEDQSVSNG